MRTRHAPEPRASAGIHAMSCHVMRGCAELEETVRRLRMRLKAVSDENTEFRQYWEDGYDALRKHRTRSITPGDARAPSPRVTPVRATRGGSRPCQTALQARALHPPKAAVRGGRGPRRHAQHTGQAFRGAPSAARPRSLCYRRGALCALRHTPRRLVLPAIQQPRLRNHLLRIRPPRVSPAMHTSKRYTWPPGMTHVVTCETTRHPGRASWPWGCLPRATENSKC